MKKILLIAGLILRLSLGLSVCSAQTGQPGSAVPEDEPPFNHAEDLLFKTIEYLGSSPGSYDELEVYTTGMAYTRSVIASHGTHGSASAVLDDEQLKALRRMLLEVGTPETVGEPQPEQRRLTLIYLSGDKYLRHDFVAPSIPFVVRSLIEKARAEIYARPRRLAGKSKPEIISDRQACARLEAEGLKLEAMSQSELGSYAGRPGLLPHSRYIAVKCYLSRFPNVDDQYMKYIRRWVERYEAGEF